MKLLLAALLLSAPLAYAQDKAVEAEAVQKTETKLDLVPAGLPHIHPIEHKNIVYRTAPDKDGKPVDQILDVYENPDGKPHPVVVYWHGGAWWKGARPASYASFRALLGMGFNVVNVDYRLTDVAPAPAGLQDARCSLSWVAKNAPQYHFDLSKGVVTYGTSSGGHYALMTGFLPAKNDVDDPACGPVPRIAAVMDFYGIPDLTGVLTSGIPLNKSTTRWLGGTGVNDPATMAMARRLSPITYLTKNSPPVFIAHGDADPVVPYQQSLDLKKKLEDLKIPVQMYTVPGALHGGFSPEQTLIINQELLKFFRSLHLIP